jgi:hypothetical protein
MTAPRSLDVRATWRRLPNFLQPLLTNLSGKPYAGQVPLFRWQPLAKAASGLLSLLLGLTLGGLALAGDAVNWPLLLLAWLVLVHAMRFLNIGVQHHASHGQVARGPLLGLSRVQANRWIGEAVSVLLLTHHEAEYRHEHATRHHSPLLATELDPDAEFLFGEVGFETGRPYGWYWRKLLRTLLSPSFYLRRLQSRLGSNFLRAPLWRRLAALLWSLSLVTMAQIFGLWLHLLLLYLLPLFVGFSISDLLQRLSEHRWFESAATDAQRLEQATQARFLGDPYPAPGSWAQPGGWRQYARFWMKLPYHAAARLGIFVADLPAHDLHHWQVASGWENALYNRAERIASHSAGHSGNHSASPTAPRRSNNQPQHPSERWGGLLGQLAATFRELSRLPAQ